MASTATTFVVSGLLGPERKFAPEDIQNAVLAGGVAVGATADMLLQPYGAVTAGTIAGVLSCLGYKVGHGVVSVGNNVGVQVMGGWLFDKLRIHDTCGVNNLHGMPGLLGGLLSVLVAGIASSDTYDKFNIDDDKR